MKRIIPFVAALALLFPLVAQGASFKGGPTITIGQQESVEGNLYTAGGTQFINAPIHGDLVAAGGTVSINGSVSGDVLVLGGTIQVFGPVSGDVRILGGTVSINGHVDGDVVVAGGTLSILPDAVIAGDVNVAGGTVMTQGSVRGSLDARGGKLEISGTVGGPVDARVDSLVLTSTARLNSALTYRSRQEANIQTGARVNGKTTYIPTMSGGPRSPSKHVGAIILGGLAFLTAFTMLVHLGAAVVLVWLWRRKATEVLHEASARFWPSVGRGVVYAILTPLACILLMVSIVGLVPGILGLMLLGIAGGVSKVIAGVFFGAWVSKMAHKAPALQITWANALLGTIGFQLIMLIPFFGGLAHSIMVLAVFGVVADATRRHLI